MLSHSFVSAYDMGFELVKKLPRQFFHNLFAGAGGALPIELGTPNPRLQAKRAQFSILRGALLIAALFGLGTVGLSPAWAEGEWEITPESETALKRGLAWLAANQGAEGNWESNDLGLVSMGALAFMAAGNAPGVGRYGANVDRALNYVLRNAKPSGLLNFGDPQRDMYNHGLSTFVLGQVHGMASDPRISVTLDRALRLIANTQCGDGGWDYRAKSQQHGHDLSLAVMQAKALRSAMDSGLEVPPEVIEAAIRDVRQHYSPANGQRHASESDQQQVGGQFTYGRGGDGGTVAMAACGVVCLQEFGQYDDWRIAKSMEAVIRAIKEQKPQPRSGQVPFDGYTLYYVGQALYQVGGSTWQDNYPKLRDLLVQSQVADPRDPRRDGVWQSGGYVGGRPGELYGTAVACFVLAIPNRYLPILQEGKIDTLRAKYQQKGSAAQ
jgi:hypothetical protein